MTDSEGWSYVKPVMNIIPIDN